MSAERRKNRAAKKANQLLNKLCLEYVKGLDAHLDDPEGEEMSLLFSKLDRHWKRYAYGKLKDCQNTFADEVKKIMEKFAAAIKKAKGTSRKRVGVAKSNRRSVSKVQKGHDSGASVDDKRHDDDGDCDGRSVHATASVDGNA